MQISCALHIQSWTPTGEKVSDRLCRQSTTNNRQPTTRYQQNNNPPTATPDNQLSALGRLPANNNQLPPTDTPKPTPDNPQSPTDWKVMQPRQGWQRQLLHASLDTNLKSTTPFVIFSSIIRYYRLKTRTEQRQADKTNFIYRSTTDDGQCRSTNSSQICRIVADSANTLTHRLYHIHITEWRWYKCTL